MASKGFAQGDMDVLDRIYDDDDTPAMPIYLLDENPLGQSYEYWIMDWRQLLMSHDHRLLHLMAIGI